MITNRQAGEYGTLHGIDWRNDFVRWYAWFSWRGDALGIVVQTRWLTTPLEWPPITALEARVVIDHYRQVREAVAKEDRNKRSGVGFKPLPDAPDAWAEWDSSFRARLLRAELDRREIDGDFFERTPRYPVRAWEALHVLESRTTEFRNTAAQIQQTIASHRINNIVRGANDDEQAS